MKLINKKIFVIILLLVGICGLDSCGNLDPVDYSEINPSNFPKTEADLESLVLSCYYPLRGSWWNGINSTSERGVMYINDATVGVITGSYGIQKKMSQLNYFPTTDDLTWFYYTRKSPYGYANKISTCTLVIDQMEKSSLAESVKAKYIAEVRCARAFLSYILYDMFGPLVVAPIEVLQNPLQEKPLARLTQAEMVKFIDDDLTYAAENLPYPGSTEYGKFSKGLAKMLQIRLYLHEAHDDNSYYKKVETLARELMTAKYGYQLQSSYPAMFEQGGQGSANKEIIFAVPCSYSGPDENQWHMTCLPTDFNQGGMSGGWGDITSTWYFYNSFEANDTRKTYLLDHYTNSSGVVIDKNTTQSPLALGPIPMKFGYDKGVSANGGLTNIDIILYRYADVYLSLAEALVMKDGATQADYQEALGYVNIIRNRAKLANLPLSAVNTKDKFIDQLLLERSHEFWCENGQLRADYIRHDKFISRVKEITQSPYALDYKKLYPLPLSVIEDGKGAVVQNSGY